MAEPAGTPIGTAFAALAASDPHRVAITCGERSVTFADFEARTNQLARLYTSLGVAADTFVTIGLPNSIEFLEAVFATWKLGATPQPISHRMPAGERAAIIELADPSLIVGVDPAEVGGRAGLAVGHEVPPELATDPLPPAIARSWKAPTSGGSTGRPKLIVATQPAVHETLALLAGFSRMQPGGVHLATGPLHHNGPFLWSTCALATGNHVVLMPRFDASTALALVEQHRVDWMYAVPTMMSRIWQLPDEERLGRDVSSLLVVFHMAAPCPPWLKEAWIDWLGPEKILELYAGTEGQGTTFIDGTEWLAHRGSVGKPMTGEMAAFDDDGERVPAGVVGTVWIRSGSAEPGYRYVGAEARAMEGGWETLGDLGWFDEDGYLYLTDRDSDMILVGGSNVYPAEVEAALLEHPSVADACVIGLTDADLGSVPHALVQLSSPVTDDDLRTYLKDRLAPYKLPRSFERVDHQLRDDAGKVRRATLRAERQVAAGPD